MCKYRFELIWDRNNVREMGEFGMKNVSKRQYILTLIVSFVAIVVLSLCTIMTFYRKSVNDTLALAAETVKQEQEYMNSYLNRAVDAVEVTKITVEHMMREGQSGQDILNFLTNESDYYLQDIDAAFTGVYGFINGEYLDGTDWVPNDDYVPRERAWYKAAVAADGQPTLGQPYIDAQTGDILMSVSQLLYDGVSVISLDVTLDQIQAETEKIKLNGQGYAFSPDTEWQKEFEEMFPFEETDDQLNAINEVKKDMGNKFAQIVYEGKDYTQGEMSVLMKGITDNDGEPFQAVVDDKKVTVFSCSIVDEWYVVMVITNEKLYHGIRNLIGYDIGIGIVLYIIIVFFCTRSKNSTDAIMSKLDETNNELTDLNNMVMQAFAKTIDAKDKYTKGHSVRVARYSRELVKRMGGTIREQDEIYQIALLHDMGKIRIPDNIINKPGRLTDEEFSMIKLHCVNGYHILKNINAFPELAVGAKYHHERYDGTGYPSGLKGENIPRCARIIAVADSYDAMTSNRSYRYALPQKIVRDEMEKGKGSQFDPDIAEVMLSMIDEDEDYHMRQVEKMVSNILVVDDEKINIRLIENICKNEPLYKVIAAESGKQAIDIVGNQQIDLVLLDIEMPDMDGFQTLEEIRKITDVPVIFVTAYKDYKLIERARQMGVEDYITKPFLPIVFLETLYGVIG